MVAHKGTQEIKTERLILRKIMPDDAEMVYKGHLKETYFSNSEWQDCDYYPITKDEYMNKNNMK